LESARFSIFIWTRARSAQKAGLTLRAVAWEDAAGVTHLAYTDPAVLKARYAIADRDKVFATMAGALRKFTAMATTKGALKAVPAK
jgi:hypothetical protein